MTFEKLTVVLPTLENAYIAPTFPSESGMGYTELEKACRAIMAEDCRPLAFRKADAMAFIMEKGQITLVDGDVFADSLNCAFADLTPFETVADADLRRASILVKLRNEKLAEIQNGGMKPLLDENRPALEELLFTGDVDFGHTCPDWKMVFTLGVPGLLARVRDYKKKDPANEFYISSEKVLAAFLGLIERFRALAAKEGKEELEKCLLTLENGAPETLYEAMELYFLYYLVQHVVEGENLRSLGNPDGLLYPFYKHDLENGVLDEENAAILVDRFLYKWSSMKIAANIPFYLAGSDPEGHDKSNAMTWLILREYEKLGIYDPKIHIRVTDDTPEALLLEVLRLIRSGKNSFVFVSDKTIERALTSIGESLEDARDYVIIGCYEPASAGREVPCTCNGRINLPKVLEVTLNEGRSMLTGKSLAKAVAFDKNDFESLLDAYLETLSETAKRTMKQISDYEGFYTALNPSPLLSSTYSSCLEKGLDTYVGGAKYNNSSICAFGLADTVDSLLAIREKVYEEKSLTLDEMTALLKSNWEGAERERLLARKNRNKYGNGLKDVEELVKKIMGKAAELINGAPNGRNGVFRLGAFSIDWRFDFGRRTAATPDGRCASEALAKNLCAVTGQDRAGVTALIESATAFDHALIPDGSVLDLSLHDSLFSGENGYQAVLSLIRTYFARHGMAIQINVLSEETLRRAKAEPEKYKNLQIRVCGWNARFIDLPEAEQDDFIERAHHIAG